MASAMQEAAPRSAPSPWKGKSGDDGRRSTVNLRSGKELKTCGEEDGRGVGGAPTSDLQTPEPSERIAATTTVAIPNSGTEVGASAKTKEIATTTNAGDKEEEEAETKDNARLLLDEDGGNLRRCGGSRMHHREEGSIGPPRCASPILARPPVLLAAVLPWVRKSDDRTKKKHGKKTAMAVKGVDLPNGSAHDGGTHGGGWCAPGWAAVREEGCESEARLGKLVVPCLGWSLVGPNPNYPSPNHSGEG